MVKIERGNTADTLQYFHESLDTHFRRIYLERMNLGVRAPVFALEHGLD